MRKVIPEVQFNILKEADAVRKFEESYSMDYYVSKFGTFYSVRKSTRVITQMKTVPDGEGYLRCQVNGKTTRVHVTVAETFIRKRDRAKKEVINHIDGNRQNNNIENIEIVTQSINIKKAWEDKKERRKLTHEEAEQIRMLHQVEGLSYNALARMMNCSATSVKQIIDGITFNKKQK